MSFSPTHILVPVAVDPDEDLMLAQQALFAACDIAAKFSSKITLLHLVPMVSPGSAGVDVSGRIYESFMKSLEARIHHGRQKLKELEVAAKDRGITIESRVMDSVEDMADVILHSAKNLKADLLVMGSHGRSGLSRVLFGSVAAKVSDRATIPVLLLHPKKA